MNELDELYHTMVEKRTLLANAKQSGIADDIIKAYREDINATKVYTDLIYSTINTESFISNAYYMPTRTIAFIMKHTM